jgi:hypothetical protein
MIEGTWPLQLSYTNYKDSLDKDISLISYKVVKPLVHQDQRYRRHDRVFRRTQASHKNNTDKGRNPGTREYRRDHENNVKVLRS